MHLTMFTDYGLRSLIYLALRPGELGSIAGIARAYGISGHHVTKVVHALGRAGLVETIRGHNGGLRLAQEAGAIRLGDVVRRMEPSLALVECAGEKPCAICGICRLQGILGEALGALLAVLDRYTLADIVAPDQAALRVRLGLEAKL